LSFIICDKNAATVIKSYSPELIVFGLLDRNLSIQYENFKVKSKFILRNLEFPIQVKNRITALVVGPGLSRNETIQDQVKTLLLNFDRNDVPIIFDGVKIFLLSFIISVRMEYHFL
jgi:ATP-dependent NAD(P)H-hydrate dehydratase